MMKNQTAFLVAPQKIEIADSEMPRVDLDDVLVETGHVGVCGSDVSFFVDATSGGRRAVTYPIILGHEMFRKELTIAGSVINPNTHYRAVELVRRLDVKGMITHRFPLDQINEAMEAARRSVGLKLCVKPNG